MEQSGGTLLADPVHAEDVVVVLDGPVPPEWVPAWCDRTGRGWRVERSPEGPGGAARAVARLAGHPVLVTRPATPRPTRPRVVAAVRDLPGDARVLAEAAGGAGQLGAELVVAHGVPVSFGERSVGLPQALDRGRRVLDAATAHLAAAAPRLPVVPVLVRRHAHEIVGEDLDADLLVLGGPRPSDGSGPVAPGLVALSALHHAPCPVLLVPRAG